MLKQSALVLFVVLITGCGFKLRGMMDKPAWLTSISIALKEAHPDLVTILKDNLQAFGVPVIPSPGRADYLLVIEKDISQQQITSISASTTPRQYQLTYSVVYSLLKANGVPMISSNMVSVTRQLTVNNDRILGSDFETTVIQTEMHREAAIKLVNRLSRK